MHIQAIAIRFVIIGCVETSGYFFTPSMSPATRITDSSRGFVSRQTPLIRPTTFKVLNNWKGYTVRNSVDPVHGLAAGGNQRCLIAFTGFGDLRIDDNEALLASLSSEHRAAAFVFDPNVISGMSERRLKLLYSAVADLHKSLENAGFSMIVRIGNFADVVLQVATEMRATDIYIHNDPVHEVAPSQ